MTPIEVNAVATSHIVPHGLAVVDGVTLEPDMLVLLTAQRQAKHSGVWIVGHGIWRRPDLPSAAHASTDPGRSFDVTDGDLFAGTRRPELAPGAFYPCTKDRDR